MLFRSAATTAAAATTVADYQVMPPPVSDEYCVTAEWRNYSFPLHHSQFPSSGPTECWEFCLHEIRCKAIVYTVFQEQNCRLFDQHLEKRDDVTALLAQLVIFVEKFCVEQIRWNVTEMIKQSHVSGIHLRNESSGKCIEEKKKKGEEKEEEREKEEEEEEEKEDEEKEEKEKEDEEDEEDEDEVTLRWGTTSSCFTLWELHLMSTGNETGFQSAVQYEIRVQLRGTELCLERSEQSSYQGVVVVRPCAPRSPSQRLWLMARPDNWYGENQWSMLTPDKVFVSLEEIKNMANIYLLTLSFVKLIVPQESSPCGKFTVRKGTVEDNDPSRPFHLPGAVLLITCDPGYGVINDDGVYLPQTRVTCTGTGFVAPKCSRIKTKKPKARVEPVLEMPLLNILLLVGIMVIGGLALVAACLLQHYKGRVKELKEETQALRETADGRIYRYQFKGGQAS